MDRSKLSRVKAVMRISKWYRPWPDRRRRSLSGIFPIGWEFAQSPRRLGKIASLGTNLNAQALEPLLSAVLTLQPSAIGNTETLGDATNREHI
jgi:hypothetical protein